MIITITLNPAIDKSTSFDRLIPEKKMRCTELTVEPGGGGINISKVIKELGGESKALFLSGGSNGRQLEKMVAVQGIEFLAIPVTKETRENFTATDLSTNAQYRFVMPGAINDEKQWQPLFPLLEHLNPRPEFIVMSGSLPPGMPVTVVNQLSILAKKLEAKLIVDTSGHALMEAVKQGVFLIKPNLSELCFLSGKEYLELSEVEAAGRSLIAGSRCENIVVSMGPAGALLMTKNDCTRIPAPVVKKRSTIGAGDSMVAGIIYYLSLGRTMVESVQFGVACGTSAIMNEGTGLCRKDEVSRLFEWIKTQKI